MYQLYILFNIIFKTCCINVVVNFLILTDTPGTVVDRIFHQEED